MFFFIIMAAIWYNCLQAIHLPNIPRNYFRKVLQHFHVQSIAKLGSVIIGNSKKQVFPCQQNVVTGPFKAISTANRQCRQLQPTLFASFPVLKVAGALVNHTQLSVQQANTFCQRHYFARHGVVTAGKIRRFTAGNFQALAGNVSSPAICAIFTWKGNFALSCLPISPVFGIKGVFTSKPGIIRKIILLVANP